MSETEPVLVEVELVHTKSKKSLFEAWTSKRHATLTKSRVSVYKDQKVKEKIIFTKQDL
jgi:hypothetical protein